MENLKIIIMILIVITLTSVPILIINTNIASGYNNDLSNNSLNQQNINMENTIQNEFEDGEAIIEDNFYDEVYIVEDDETLLNDKIEEELTINKETDEVANNLSTVNEDVTKNSTISNKSNKVANTTNTSIKTTPTKVATKPITTSMPYYIKVNRTQNVVNVFSKDADGNYTIPFKAMICSIGTSTPRDGSKYKITTYRRTWNALKGNVYGQYAVQITGNILFHSVPYTAKNNYSLEYWEYDKLGTKASMGCIRLTVQDAKWIYDNIGAGTWVEFYEDDNPGPLGKPSSKIISDNELCRNWDPTDYVEGNPWHTENIENNEYVEEIETVITQDESNYIENTINETETNSIKSINAGTNTNDINTSENTNNNEEEQNIIIDDVGFEKDNSINSEEEQNIIIDDVSFENDESAIEINDLFNDEVNITSGNIIINE